MVYTQYIDKTSYTLFITYSDNIYALHHSFALCIISHISETSFFNEWIRLVVALFAWMWFGIKMWTSVFGHVVQMPLLCELKFKMNVSQQIYSKLPGQKREGMGEGSLLTCSCASSLSLAITSTSMYQCFSILLPFPHVFFFLSFYFCFFSPEPTST